MKISTYTKKELDVFRKEANFTDFELSCFNLKAKDLTNYQVAMELNVCESTITTTMKNVRAKIVAVMEEKAKTDKNQPVNTDALNPMISYLIDFFMKLLANSPFLPESHTAKEWLELPDKVSIKDKWYVVLDFRTDDNKPSVPRFKYGDGVTMVSKLPFCTAAITDNDVRLWDLQMQISEKKH